VKKAAALAHLYLAGARRHGVRVFLAELMARWHGKELGELLAGLSPRNSANSLRDASDLDVTCETKEKAMAWFSDAMRRKILEWPSSERKRSTGSSCTRRDWLG